MHRDGEKKKVNFAVVCTSCFHIEVVDLARWKSRICPACRRRSLCDFVQKESDGLLRIGGECAI